MPTDDNAGGTSRAPLGATGERRGTSAREPGKIRKTGPDPPAPHALMSFAVKRAQAAEPNTAAYTPCKPRFFSTSSQ